MTVATGKCNINE